MKPTDYRREAIAQNIGSLKGIGAFEVGDTISCRGKVLTIIEFTSEGEINTWEHCFLPPHCCAYPDDESLWSDRQTRLVDSICEAMERVKL